MICPWKITITAPVLLDVCQVVTICIQATLGYLIHFWFLTTSGVPSTSWPPTPLLASPPRCLCPKNVMGISWKISYVDASLVLADLRWWVCNLTAVYPRRRWLRLDHVRSYQASGNKIFLEKHLTLSSFIIIMIDSFQIRENIYRKKRNIEREIVFTWKFRSEETDKAKIMVRYSETLRERSQRV